MLIRKTAYKYPLLFVTVILICYEVVLSFDFDGKPLDEIDFIAEKNRVPQKFPVGHAANSTGDWLSIPHFAGDRQKLLCSSQSFQQLHLHVENVLDRCI